MPESTKTLTVAEAEKDRLRQKLLRLIVERENRRGAPAPHHPQFKR